VSAIDASQMYISGSSFRNSYMKSEVQQLHLFGDFAFNDEFSLDFGVMSTDVNNRSAFANVQRDTWGGAGSPADYNDSDFIPDTVSRYFDQIPGHDNSTLFNDFFRWDFDSIIAQAAAANGGMSGFLASNNYSVDRRTEEDTVAAYVQFNAAFDIGDKSAHLAAGLRYEQTDVTSSALVPIATGILWTGNNEFSVQKGAPDFTTLTGDYDYVLPSIDFNVEVMDNMIVRASYSQTIGRPGWDQIQGGQTINDLIRIDGGDGNQGDPGLLPLESTNIDLSWEWYFDEGSYVAATYFTKDIDNYIGITTVSGTPFDLPHPGQGARFDEANAATGGTNDLSAIRQYIFTNYGNTPEVVITGTDVNGNFTGTIAGIAGEDPAAIIDIFVPSNQSSESLDGWEFAVQHMFGDSGFGFSANYTIVNTDSTYDDTNLAQQFVLLGISDSANFIGFFENEKWSVRAAYNWRDQYISGTFDGNGNPNPNYVEDYGQWDMNVSYDVTDGLTVFAEAINITDEYQRVHGRGENVALYVTQTGPRYMLGARYNFK
jgi:TonB-dependent receptor